MPTRKIIVLITLFCSFMALSTIASARDVKIVTDDWAPYYGKNLDNQGFFCAIAKEAFQYAGYNAYISFIPWKRAEQLARKGKEDALLGAYHTKEREEFFFYSDPIIMTSMNLIARKDFGIVFDGDLAKLKKYKIGKVRGYSVSDEFSAAGLNLEEATTLTQNMKKLLAGRVDAVVDSPVVVKDLMNNEFPKSDLDSLVFLDPPIVKTPLYICFSKKMAGVEEVVKNFNNALKKMKQNGRIDDIQKSYGF